MEPTTFRVPVYAGLDQWTLFHWLTDHSTVGVPARHLACILALDYYRESSGYAYPGMDVLARRMQMSVRNVKRLVGELRDSGEWVVVTGDGRRKNQERSVLDSVPSNLYYPVLPADSLPEGVRILRYDTVTMRERIPVAPQVPIETYDADAATGVYVDVSALPEIPSEADERFLDALYVERVAEEPAPTPVPTPAPSTEPRAAMEAVEAWIADVMPDRVAEVQFAGKALRTDIEAAAQEVIASGHTVSEVLTAALRHTRGEVKSVAGWLAKVALPKSAYFLGLESGRTNGVSEGEAQVHTWLNSGFADIDYGVSGQEF